MIHIMFVCHGNICRSTMAEFVFRHMVSQEGLGNRIRVSSSATSREEIGNPVHPGTRKKLQEVGISCDGKTAVQLTKEDYKTCDLLIGMDTYNLRNMERILGGDPDKKVFRLLDFVPCGNDIADPWYTGDFDATYEDVVKGCVGLMAYIKDNLL